MCDNSKISKGYYYLYNVKTIASRNSKVLADIDLPLENFILQLIKTCYFTASMNTTN